MKERIPGMPGPVSHVLCVITALALTLVLTCGALSILVNRVLFDASLHESVALDDAVLDAQYARVGAAVDALAEEYPFEPSTVMDRMDRDAVAGYGKTVVAWWMGLIKADPQLSLPDFTVEGLEDAVREDETFLAETPSTKRKSVARDKIAAGATRAVEDAVVPLRTMLISLGLKQVLDGHDVAGMAAKLPYLPAVLAGVAAVLTILMLLFAHKRVVKAVYYAGCAMAASALTLCGVAVLAVLLRLPEQIGTVSELLSLQARLLLGRLGVETAILAGVLLVGGLLLIGVHQHSMRRIALTLRRAGIEA